MGHRLNQVILNEVVKAQRTIYPATSELALGHGPECFTKVA